MEQFFSLVKFRSLVKFWFCNNSDFCQPLILVNFRFWWIFDFGCNFCLFFLGRVWKNPELTSFRSLASWPERFRQGEGLPHAQHQAQVVWYCACGKPSPCRISSRTRPPFSKDCLETFSRKSNICPKSKFGQSEVPTGSQKKRHAVFCPSFDRSCLKISFGERRFWSNLDFGKKFDFWSNVNFVQISSLVKFRGWSKCEFGQIAMLVNVRFWTTFDLLSNFDCGHISMLVEFRCLPNFDLGQITISVELRFWSNCEFW